jgi:putative MATE family efflux protein
VAAQKSKVHEVEQVKSGPSDNAIPANGSDSLEEEVSITLDGGSSPEQGAALVGPLDGVVTEAREDLAAEPPIESGSELRKKITDLAVPALIEMTLMTLVSMVDMIQVGRLGPWAITSVGLSNQPMFIAMSVFMSLNVGATALVARSVGAKKIDDAFAGARQALVIASLFGLVLGALGITYAGPILRILGAEADVIGPGTAYLRIVSAGLIFQGATVSLNASLRGAGDTRTPMSVNLIANLVNVVGNYRLINGAFGFPRLEVAGAAYATTFSRLVALVLVVSKVFGHRGAIKMSITDSFRPDLPILRRIFKVGIPAALEQLVMRSGQMVFARIVASFGTLTYAAHQVALNIEGFSFTTPQAFQTAATTLVGQSLGAKRPKRAIRVGAEAQKIAIGIGLFMGTILFLFGKYVAVLYTDDPSVISLSAGVLKIIAFAQPFMATNFVLAGALRGAGDTKWTMYITMAGVWGVRVVTAYFLCLHTDLHLYGAWIAMALDMTTRAILVTLRFRAGHWTKTRV